MAGAQQKCLVEWPSNELKAGRQTALGKARGQAEGREAEIVKRPAAVTEPDDVVHESGIRAHVAFGDGRHGHRHDRRSEEHTSELQSLMRISYAVFCLKKKKKKKVK